MSQPSILTIDQIPGIVSSMGSREKAISVVGELALNFSTLKENTISIPPTFVITSESKSILSNNKGHLTEAFWQEILKTIREFDDRTGAKYGNKNPAFYNVVGEIPGVSIVNLGFNDFTVHELERQTNNKAFAYKAYSRLVASYAALVHSIPSELFDETMKQFMVARNISAIKDFSALEWIQITKLFKGIFVHYVGRPFPQDPYEQIKNALEAVLNSKYTISKQKYIGRINTDFVPTALIQRVYFGGKDSHSSVVISSTNELQTGRCQISGIYYPQCELFDIINGYFPPRSLEDFAESYPKPGELIKSQMFQISSLFNHAMTAHFVVNDDKPVVMNIEKTHFSCTIGCVAAMNLIESGKDKLEVIKSMMPCELSSVISSQVKSGSVNYFCRGLSGANGAVVGRASLSNEDCLARVSQGEKVVLFKHSVTPADLDAVLAASAVVTESGSDFCFASILTRSLGIPAAIACGDLSIDATRGEIVGNGITLNVGDEVTVENGGVFSERQELTIAQVSEESQPLVNLLKELRSKCGFHILSSANNSEEVKASIECGCDGIGSYNIDSIFEIEENKQKLIDFLIDIDNNEKEKEVMRLIMDNLTEAMSQSPNHIFTIKLLTNGIGFYLPSAVESTRDVAELRVRKQYEKDFNRDEELESKIKQLELVKKYGESNPLMGLRGARLSIRHPKVFDVQAKGLYGAIVNTNRSEESPRVRIMVPLMSVGNELKHIEQRLGKICDCGMVDIGPLFGSPRSCLASGEFLNISNFMCVDVKGLQETTFGMTERDARRTFLQEYVDWRIIDDSPFDSVDFDGAAQLIKHAASKSTDETPVGVLGDFIGSKTDIINFKKFGLSYIICSSSKVPLVSLSCVQTI
ncbi:PEP-utilizing enzyme, mobile domain containing protein [Trichomonas vaginalis G3]|uniref:pyruvate, phosphate dikinase n=1 Tax=Trichomonas vaginalis (strain ATCC PRA-98 / G3) TaxID=412133 RepID=A2G0W0_TRIV3|nr:phosphoenolpyruvate dikinase-related family [Trichomonas vaginalis G3]EAX89206.1 PEP-utilizing enzyme, mobile domain containing protein [Trichomonas vaginalis G3]KAI5551338.1 phosphoenolpyruvate dikinase-related family [Trichomonas vaginalis G3]|eukprot:XP_001302136.1 PEP-utilizing enzyme, mobile domain containing protein [Trichomonas vaginalis G3]